MRVPISRTRLGLEALITSSRIFPFSGPITGMKFRSPIFSISLRTASALSIVVSPRDETRLIRLREPLTHSTETVFYSSARRKGRKKDVCRAGRLEGGSEADIEDSRP